jgi:DNA-binding response OmpR family regulator
MKPRILFLDDEPHMRNLLSLYLRHEGMEIAAVATSQEAKALFCETPFDLTILDWYLGGEDGWDMLNFIKSKNSKHPVIIYSGVDEDELAQKKAFLGRADAVVRKRASLASLLAEIRRHLPPDSATGAAHSEPVPSS